MPHKRHVKGHARNSFGKALVATRKRHGHTVRSACALIGVSRTTWNETELGNREPFEEHQIDKIVRALMLPDDEAVALRIAAARTRGWFALPSARLSEEQLALGVDLVRAWPKLDRMTIKQISETLRWMVK